jgi:hypothetical protein
LSSSSLQNQTAVNKQSTSTVKKIYAQQTSKCWGLCAIFWKIHVPVSTCMIANRNTDFKNA